jgi:hypothetical protein
MAQEHVEDLRLARAALVKARRNSAKILGTPFHRGNTDRAIRDVIDLQHAIEAIDRAIVDEEKLIGEGKEKALTG